MNHIRYFCRINTPADEHRYGTRLHIGPAYKKVQAVARAVASSGVAIEIVSLPVVRLPKINIYLSSISSDTGLVINRSYGALGIPILDRGLSALIFAREAISAIAASDKVIIYNFFPEYILAAALLKMAGQPAYMDIEDAPRDDEKGVRGAVTRFCFKVLNRLTSERKITVSQKVSEVLKLKEACIIYGATAELSARTDQDRDLLKEKWNCCDRIKVLYGGSLMLETGVEVFLNACKKLINDPWKCQRGLDIYVTGFGGETYISELVELAKDNEWIRVIVEKDLPSDQYDALLSSVHAALCLKLPGTGIGDTTFPSKVVEISGAGLLLITTPVSDVPALFDSQSAVLLSTPYHESLAAELTKLVQFPELYREIAYRGQAVAIENFGEVAVGKRISNYVGLLT